jgi:hypothetical protein
MLSWRANASRGLIASLMPKQKRVLTVAAV